MSDSPPVFPARSTASSGAGGASTWIVRPEILKPVDPVTLFGNANPVELELGAGDGSFIARHAAGHPQRNFLAIERLLGRLRKIDRKARAQGITNLRGMRIEAGYLMERMLAPGSLAAIHVYFPDPWPKRRHWKHRLIQSGFAAHARAALADGGVVYLRTDHPGYFEQMLEVFAGAAGFEPVSAPPALLAIQTDFERDFNAQGIPTRVASYRKTPPPGPCAAAAAPTGFIP